MAERLTDRQREIYEWIKAYIEREQCPPSYRQIGAHFGIKSVNGVQAHIRTLIRKGYLELGGNRADARRIRVLYNH